MFLNKEKLHIRCKFKHLEFVVCDTDGRFYQLEHFDKRLKPFRELQMIKVGGSYGYRINRRFYSCSRLRKLAIPVNEHIELVNESYTLPF